MSLEQTIRDTVMLESMDLDGRLQQLVRAGLMPSNTLPLLRKAIAKVQGGMSLQGPERDVMATFINTMMYIVLGDDTIFNKARAGAKNYATEEVELDENAKIVAHLVKRYGDNIRKSHVVSAANDFGVDASKLSKAVRKKLGKTMLEAKEKQEYDYEGDMAMSQLKSIIANSQRMHDSMSEDTNLPEWVQSKITLAEDYISTAANYLQGEVSEEVQIDELSKKTLGSYVKKASGAEQPKNVMSPKNVPLTKIAAYQGDSETGHFGKRFNQHTYDKAERLRKNRETGIKRAVDKITKEDVEQVDEISKATMGRYINKAKDSIDMTSYRSGIKDGTAISSSTPYKSNNPLERKLTKRHKGISMAVKKLTKEESEQIDELSKKTLGSYVNKAAERIGTKGVTAGLKIAADEKSSANFKDMGKRQKGISRAVNKLTKEDIDAVKQMNESYKTAFDTALTEYNIKSPSELDESKRKEFFNYVDQEFKKGDK